jgi:hypothetical protein
MDYEAMLKAPNEDLWVYDKLILSMRLGYCCGVVIPEDGEYFIKPVMNLYGMGAGARREFLKKGHHVAPGYFWSEVFRGRHLSVDYENWTWVRCSEGFGGPQFTHWKEIPKAPSFPEELKVLKSKEVNVEFLGGKIIEVHLRHNPDPENVRVIYDGIPEIWSEDDGGGYAKKRLGFKKI